MEPTKQTRKMSRGEEYPWTRNYQNTKTHSNSRIDSLQPWVLQRVHPTANRTCYIEGRLPNKELNIILDTDTGKLPWSQPEQKPVRYEKCLNHLTKPLPGLLRHAMILEENSFNQFYAVGEELCKLQLQQLICSIHQLSLTLKNSTKIANENLNQLSLTVQTTADSTNTAR